MKRTCGLPSILQCYALIQRLLFSLRFRRFRHWDIMMYFQFQYSPAIYPHSYYSYKLQFAARELLSSSLKTETCGTINMKLMTLIGGIHGSRKMHMTPKNGLLQLNNFLSLNNILAPMFWRLVILEPNYFEVSSFQLYNRLVGLSHVGISAVQSRFALPFSSGLIDDSTFRDYSLIAGTFDIGLFDLLQTLAYHE